MQLNIPNPTLFVLLAIWEMIWKGFTLWKAAKNNQRYWFVAILILNTLGILPVIYMRFFQKKRS